MPAPEKSANSPVELVLIALCACTWERRGRDPAQEARALHQPGSPRHGRTHCRLPQVYTSIRVIYRVGGNVTHKAMEDAVRLSKEKYCSVSAMLEKTAKIEFAIEYAG